MGNAPDQHIDPSIQTAVPICRDLKAHAFIEREFAGAGHALKLTEKVKRRSCPAQREDLTSNSAVGTV